MATQNPIESEGTYPLPEAQVDRFLMKILVDYPSVGEEAAVVGRSLGGQAEVHERVPLSDLERYSEAARTVLVDRDVIAYSVALADATRNPDALRPRRPRGPDRVRGQPPRARSAWPRPPACWRCCAAAAT